MRALAFTSVFALAPRASGQITIVDAGTDQPASSAHLPPTITPVKLAPAAQPSTLGEGGDAVQVHAARVAALTSFSRSLSLACTSTSADVDKVLLERAAIRAIALRQGIADIEQREKRLRQESAQRPNDGRIRAELATVIQQKQRILDAAKREVSGKLGDAAQSIGTLRSSLCSELCTHGEKSSNPVDLCAFSSPALAHAAVISDEESVRALATYVNHRFDALHINLPSKQSLSLSEMALAEPGISPVFAVADAASRVLEEQHTGLDVAAFTIGALDIGIKAVASLIIDRAKRESIIWLTRRLHEDVCGGANASLAAGYGDVRSFWFPTTCALAGGSVQFMQYGDADLIRTLRGAIATDVSAWHGAALGLSLGSTLWSDVKLDESLFTCDANADELPSCTESSANRSDCERRRDKLLACRATTDVRLSGAKLAKSLGAGANASLALYNFAGDVERINTYASEASGTRRFFSDRLELLACAAAIPYVFQEYGDLVRQTKPGKVEESKALLLAAITNSPACFSLFGRGLSRQACGGLSEATAGSADSICPRIDPGKPLDVRLQPMSALQTSGKLEKLTTILRWANLVDGPAADLTTRWFAVVDAYRAYLQAAEEMTKTLPSIGSSTSPVDLSGVTNADKVSDVFRAAGAYAENAARLAERTPKLRVARASLVLARASLDLATSFLDSTDRALSNVATISQPGMFGSWYEQDKPGQALDSQVIVQLLFPGLGVTPGLSVSAVRKTFVETRADVRRLSEAIDTLEAVFADDWGRVVARVVATMREDVERSCTSTHCKEACARGEGGCAIVAKIGQYSGLFAALAFESDPERVAAAIDAAASPGGGYRRKNVPGALTISLGSFAGLSGGTELRFGSYGGRRETGKVPYLAAPTLTLPVGIDFARGFGTHNLGVFVSAIDPAAYLQYDAAAGGTLPGAQLVTVLAPGAWLHASIFDSPFTLGLYGVFRPGLRSDTSALSIPSAHALQFGVSAAVDVTLFDLFSSSASVRK